jgi:hypothetical protein
MLPTFLPTPPLHAPTPALLTVADVPPLARSLAQLEHQLEAKVGCWRCLGRTQTALRLSPHSATSPPSNRP